MKPVVLPMLHLLGSRQNGGGFARDVGLLAPAHTQHSLELARENFDESRGGFVPVIENPLSAAAAGEFLVARNEVTHALNILCFRQRFQVDGVHIATFLGKISTLVEDIGDASAHARRKVSAAGAKDKNEAIRHVFTAMIAYAFNDGGRSGIAHGKTFAGYAIQKGFAAGGAVKRYVSDD